MVNSDSRDQLWKAAFESYYDAFLEEIVAGKILRRWQRLDDCTNVLVALTASGSAVAGWSLWGEPYLKFAWLILAGVGALVAIVHPALRVPARLDAWRGIERHFAALRNDIMTFRYKMAIDSEFPVQEFMKEFETLRQRIGEGSQLIQPDVLKTDALVLASQNQLDNLVERERMT